MRFLVVTLCCFVGPPIVRADSTEDAAIKVIKQLGGQIKQNGEVVDLSRTQVTDAELKELAALKNLATLNLSETWWVTGAGIKELAALKNLTTLDLCGLASNDSTPGGVRKPLLNDDGVKELATLRNLRSLVLAWTSVTPAGLKAVAALKNLTILNLSCSDVTDAGLKELATLRNLATLHLAYTVVTDAGLKELAALKNLTTLNLSRARV